eukprot:CAMPEP_0177650172 /NCGR_PEP_ID=MMETSP0447-20121125/11791_1 /TAXON_ID=0 /ORGANISM="Stygamoeba regulata, Strain BSH-02190019" /LENGTH=531 /DNA_ID=CAMNT_0019153005 /DNA_START=41 /DNA_END=1636 /DNA_ORIENTATION=-
MTTPTQQSTSGGQPTASSSTRIKLPLTPRSGVRLSFVVNPLAASMLNKNHFQDHSHRIVPMPVSPPPAEIKSRKERKPRAGSGKEANEKERKEKKLRREKKKEKKEKREKKEKKEKKKEKRRRKEKRKDREPRANNPESADAQRFWVETDQTGQPLEAGKTSSKRKRKHKHQHMHAHRDSFRNDDDEEDLDDDEDESNEALSANEEQEMDSSDEYTASEDDQAEYDEHHQRSNRSTTGKGESSASRAKASAVAAHKHSTKAASNNHKASSTCSSASSSASVSSSGASTLSSSAANADQDAVNQPPVQTTLPEQLTSADVERLGNAVWIYIRHRKTAHIEWNTVALEHGAWSASVCHRVWHWLMYYPDGFAAAIQDYSPEKISSDEDPDSDIESAPMLEPSLLAKIDVEVLRLYKQAQKRAEDRVTRKEEKKILASPAAEQPPAAKKVRTTPTPKLVSKLDISNLISEEDETNDDEPDELEDEEEQTEDDEPDELDLEQDPSAVSSSPLPQASAKREPSSRAAQPQHQISTN